jgi:transcription factor E2F3
MEENKIDSWMENIKLQFEKLTENNEFKDYGYVTFDDIKALTLDEDINLIAIKAPTGTSLEIPDPEQIKSIYTQTFEVNKFVLLFRI